MDFLTFGHRDTDALRFENMDIAEELLSLTDGSACEQMRLSGRRSMGALFRCPHALVNCGKEKPEAVIAVFERQIALEKQEINIRCCNDAIERIGQLTRGKFRQPMSLRDVKTVLQRMIS